MRNSLLYSFILAFLILSCEESTRLDLRQTSSKIVIEGLVTNKPAYQSVRISRTTQFYETAAAPRVTNAEVKVIDDTNNNYHFVHNPRNHPDSAGIYVPENGFTGEIGRTYTLRVEVDGESFEGSDKLVRVTTIDSLKFRINEDQREDPHEPGKTYELLIFAREPQDENNFYLFKYYRNDSLVVYNSTDVYYSDDALLGEQIDGIPSRVYFGQGDKARLEVYSLSRQGYVFYSDLSTILNNDGGGMFGPIPAPPRTNLSNDALGFFQVSAVEEREINIAE